jgi:hypothetical protein
MALEPGTVLVTPSDLVHVTHSDPGDQPLVVSQPEPRVLRVSPGGAELAKRYFALDHDPSMIRRTFPPDLRGIRRRNSHRL